MWPKKVGGAEWVVMALRDDITWSVRELYFRKNSPISFHSKGSRPGEINVVSSKHKDVKKRPPRGHEQPLDGTMNIEKHLTTGSDQCPIRFYNETESHLIWTKTSSADQHIWHTFEEPLGIVHRSSPSNSLSICRAWYHRILHTNYLKSTWNIVFVSHLGGQGWPEHPLLNHELVGPLCIVQCKGPGWPSKTQVTTSCVTWEIRTLIKIFDQLNVGHYVRQEVYSPIYKINNLV